MENKEVSEETLRSILSFVDSDEMSRYSSWYAGRYLSFFQDFNSFTTPHVDVSHSNSDEADWLVHIGILFWAMEISWNGRKESWGITGRALYTLIGIVIIAILMHLASMGIYYLRNGEFFQIDLPIVVFDLSIASAVSLSIKLRRMLKKL